MNNSKIYFSKFNYRLKCLINLNKLQMQSQPRWSTQNYHTELSITYLITFPKNPD